MALPVISYSSKPYVFVESGTAISTLTPSNSGGAATSWSIDTPLPTGLSFNTSTGVISGTPTQSGICTTYTVTATNADGSDFENVTIHVINSGLPKYYISASGSTGNTGTSAASPWPLSKVSTITSGYILFKKGDTFSGTLNITNSGTSGAPIILDLYGSATNNAVIDGGAVNTPLLQISGNYVTVNNLVLQNNTHVNGLFYIASSAHDVTVYNCYVNNGKRGIYSLSSGSSGGVCNIKIINNYVTNVSDTTHAGGSFIQFNNTNGSGNYIGYNYCYTDMSLPDSSRTGVGDIINLFQSNGTAAGYITVHQNYVRGGSSYSGGEAGLILGDVGGSYQKAYKNYFFNAGVAQMQIQGGTYIYCNNNFLYSAQWSYNMQGISFANYSSAACNNITCGNNKVNVIDKNGVAYSWFIDNSGHSTSTGVTGGAALDIPTGWSTNTAQYSADSSITNSMIPDPLWTGSPWNTTSGIVPTISYSPSSKNLVVGTATSNWTPSYSGDVATGWSISPALPAGLSFNTSNGVISGTPTAASASQSYTITATNTTGNGATVITVYVAALVSDSNIRLKGHRLRIG